MPTHTVKQGDHLSGIARRYGFYDAMTIWDDAENADLAALREDPHVLLPGDQLVIPEMAPRDEEAATGERHRYRVAGPPLKLRLAVENVSEQAVASTTGTLEIDGRATKKQTDGDGLIEQPVPRTARRGKLTIGRTRVRFRIGHLDPVEELSGVWARLNNLGYGAGDIESEPTRTFYSAVEEFQCDQGLTVDGICGPNTQAKLREVHGC